MTSVIGVDIVIPSWRPAIIIIVYSIVIDYWLLLLLLTPNTMTTCNYEKPILLLIWYWRSYYWRPNENEKLWPLEMTSTKVNANEMTEWQ